MRLVSFFFFSSRRRHTICSRDWSSDVCSSDLPRATIRILGLGGGRRSDPGPTVKITLKDDSGGHGGQPAYRTGRPAARGLAPLGRTASPVLSAPAGRRRQSTLGLDGGGAVVPGLHPPAQGRG